MRLHAILAALALTPLATAAPADFIIDDAIATPLICVGVTCIDGEAYLPGTQVKIKASSPGLEFDDTDGNNALFPDWYLNTNVGPVGLFEIGNVNAGIRIFAIEGNAPSNALYVAGNGNVGLGTSLPLTDLHITSSLLPGILFQQTSAGGQTPYAWDIFASSSGFSVFNRTASTTTASMVPFRVSASAPNTALSVGANGVGFGIANPATNLHLVDGSGPRWRMEQTGATPYIWDTVAFNGGYIIQDITATDATGSLVGPFGIQSGSPNDALNVGPGGIGMGTGAPQAPLHVRRASTNTTPDFAAGILVEDTGTVAPRGLLTLRNQGQVFFVLEDTSIAAGDNTGRAWNFQNLGGEFRVTTAPGGGSDIEMRLDVNGNMRIEGNYFANSFTQMMVPDYVFEPDYALRPLSEVASFVAEHKHLPEVPSASQIVAEGVNLNEMQMTLLKKIEELTLYALEQDRINRAQAADLARLLALEAENAALATRLARLEAVLRLE